MDVLQCRMARAGLGWTLDDLSERSGVGRRTVAKFELGGSVRPDNVETLRHTFVKAGVEFLNGGKSVGVRVPRMDEA